MHGLYQFSKIVLTLILAISVSQAQATEGFYETGRKGFYWYETKIVIEDEEYFKQPDPDPFTQEDLWLMNPKKFKEVLEGRFHLAIQAPTEQNVYRYIEIQDVAKRKSKAFSGVMGMVSQIKPEFSGRNITTMPAAGQKAYYRLKNQNRQNLLREGQHNFALIVFESAGCDYCEAQRPIIEAFQANSGWSVSYIDIYENQRLSAKYNVDMTPTIMMLYRQTNELIHVSKGVVALADLQERVARAVRYIGGQTNAEQWFKGPDHLNQNQPSNRGGQSW